ncbi:pseudouridine synthase [Microbulbifer sp. OS29]|uniref:tRNA pseudouridine synthase C n=1 Tax=Microbulbifer okhotskensis TaxID=2926617 RepID=A0A9X2EPE0_9GAMM|nr:pseudouridine synthase [Microbulbifer okhotskensis]MCO1333308.1 pseudouridine synthase [Microbulbifer okhotskensis]
MTTNEPRILFEDDYLLAAYKPEGWLVHRSDIDRHEQKILLQYLRNQCGGFLYPVHRLDKPTSGVIIFAKSGDIAAQLQKQLESDLSVKKYIAVCRGYCSEGGTIDHALAPVADFKHQRKRPKADLPRQPATTLFKRLKTIELPYEVDRYPTSRYSLVEVQLKTGRRHQIRRHFKHIQHPLIGCPKYGKSTHNRFFANRLGCSRLLLHALELVLKHPKYNTKLRIESAIRGEFSLLLKQLKWEL